MHYKVGTMIEIPRAALTADEIAKEAEFFSFGTNDLTQMTFGFSRDDAGKFLDAYYDKKIYENDPFAKLDQTGVGKLVEMAADLGKQTRPDIKLGICGEHGGDPSSVEFCHRCGPELRILLALPRADRKTGSCSGGAERLISSPAPFSQTDKQAHRLAVRLFWILPPNLSVQPPECRRILLSFTRTCWYHSTFPPNRAKKAAFSRFWIAFLPAVML